MQSAAVAAAASSTAGPLLVASASDAAWRVLGVARRSVASVFMIEASGARLQGRDSREPLCGRQLRLGREVGLPSDRRRLDESGGRRLLEDGRVIFRAGSVR